MNVGWLSTFVHLKNEIPFFYKKPSLTYDIREVSVHLIVFSLRENAMRRPVEHMGPGGANVPPILGPDRSKTFFLFLNTGDSKLFHLPPCLHETPKLYID